MGKPISVCVTASSPEGFISYLLTVEEKVDKNSCTERLNIFPMLTFILTPSSQTPHKVLVVRQHVSRLFLKAITLNLSIRTFHQK